MDQREGLIIEDITENVKDNKKEMIKAIETDINENSEERKIKNEEEKENIENSIAKIPEEKEKFGIRR